MFVEWVRYVGYICEGVVMNWAGRRMLPSIYFSSSQTIANLSFICLSFVHIFWRSATSSGGQRAGILTALGQPILFVTSFIACDLYIMYSTYRINSLKTHGFEN